LRFVLTKLSIAPLALITVLLCSSIAAAQARSLFVTAASDRITREMPGSRGKTLLSRVCPVEANPLAARVLSEYGSIFVASDDVRLPSTCIFGSGPEVDKFQSELEIMEGSVGGVQLELQRPAMLALLKVIDELALVGKKITPLDGRVAARRSFEDTVRIWNSRFHPALDHWTRLGRIAREEAEWARQAPLQRQAEKVMEWESRGLYFSTDLSRSIFRSVAPPGTSQHLSLLAFDVVESRDAKVRSLLNKHGWYQTILTDEPHFTYLGLSDSELSRRGLTKITRTGGTYWIPAFDAAANPPPRPN
jgi:hypothetical protein